MKDFIPKSPDNTKKAGELLKGLSKSAKEGLQSTVEKTAEIGKDMMGWFKELFTKSKEKGLKKSLMGVFVGVLAYLSTAGKKIKDKVQAVKDNLGETGDAAKTKSKKAREELKAKVGECPVLPDISAKFVDRIPESIKGTPKAILMAAEILEKNNVRGDNCWKWTDKVFALAGCERRQIFNSVKLYASGKYEMVNGKKQYVKTPDCGKYHAYEKEYNEIEPGDHIFINNKNKLDKHGNHSVIFVKWINKENLIAETIGYSGPKWGIRRGKTDFNKKPVTWIAKPIAAKKSAPLVA